jgi:hypothetical protein
MINIKILIASTLLAASSILAQQQVGAFLGADSPNITDFEQRGLLALAELADMTTHIPESFTISKRKAHDTYLRLV